MKLFVLFVLAVLLALSACNLPVTPMAGGTMPASVLVNVAAAAEYRTGPGPAYDVAGVLEPGRQVAAVGRSPDGAYLLIQDPGDPTVRGWLAAADAAVMGDPIGLPVSTPPPTPTPVSSGSGCPTPIGGGPTPVSCATLVPGSSSGSGCPTPIGGGPTPVSCATLVPGSSSGSGCPTPIGGGPTPVSCATLVPGSSSGSGCPTPIGGGPTPVSCGKPRRATSVGKPTALPTPVK
jgi:hypothetical protein